MDNRTKFYIGLGVIVIFLVAIYPFISSSGQFVKGSRNLETRIGESQVPNTLICRADQVAENMPGYSLYGYYPAQSFIPTQSKLSRIDVYLSIGGPQTLDVRIVPEGPNGPLTTEILSSDIITITTTGWWVELDITDVDLIPGNKYYIWINNDLSQNLWAASSSSYPEGSGWTGVGTPNQMQLPYDLAFRTIYCNQCGDGLCNDNETCSSCSQDCGLCCGNGICDIIYDETCATCSQDCGLCCGNGFCDYDETSATCAIDCGTLETTTTQSHVITDLGVPPMPDCETFCDQIGTECVRSIISNSISGCSATLSIDDVCICTSSVFKPINTVTMQ